MDEAGSNGFVKYRIKAKQGLEENALVKNSATIYFDYNRGIKTNTTENILTDRLTTSTAQIDSGKIRYSVYPNPTSGTINISTSLNESKVRIRIYDNQGKMIMASSENTLPLSIELTEQGLYFVNIINEYSDQTYKVIVTN